MGTATQFVVDLYAKRRDRASERGDLNIAALCNQVVENLRLSDADSIVIEANVLAEGVENVMRNADTEKFVAGSCFPNWVTDSLT